MNPALLIIDLQKEFIGHRKDELIYKQTLEYVNYVSAMFRKAEKNIFGKQTLRNS